MCGRIVPRNVFTKGDGSDAMSFLHLGGIFTFVTGKDSIDIRVDFEGDCQLQLNSYGEWRCVNMGRIDKDKQWCWCLMMVQFV